MKVVYISDNRLIHNTGLPQEMESCTELNLFRDCRSICIRGSGDGLPRKPSTWSFRAATEEASLLEAASGRICTLR
jgi:hypothetical protein